MAQDKVIVRDVVRQKISGGSSGPTGPQGPPGSLTGPNDDVVDQAAVVFDGTAGNLVQETPVRIDPATGDVTGVRKMTMTGTGNNDVLTITSDHDDGARIGLRSPDPDTPDWLIRVYSEASTGSNAGRFSVGSGGVAYFQVLTSRIGIRTPFVRWNTVAQGFGGEFNLNTYDSKVPDDAPAAGIDHIPTAEIRHEVTAKDSAGTERRQYWKNYTTFNEGAALADCITDLEFDYIDHDGVGIRRSSHKWRAPAASAATAISSLLLGDSHWRIENEAADCDLTFAGLRDIILEAGRDTLIPSERTQVGQTQVYSKAANGGPLVSGTAYAFAHVATSDRSSIRLRVSYMLFRGGSVTNFTGAGSFDVAIVSDMDGNIVADVSALYGEIAVLDGYTSLAVVPSVTTDAVNDRCEIKLTQTNNVGNTSSAVFSVEVMHSINSLARVDDIVEFQF